MGGSNYPFRARPGVTLALLALGFVFLGGCTTPTRNTVVIENNGTNTVVTMPATPSSITSSNPVAIATTNSISISVNKVEAGPSAPGTELTNSNLLVLLAVLVALSVYLAGLRRTLIPKLEEAKLDLAKLKADNVEPEQIGEKEIAVAELEVDLEKDKLLTEEIEERKRVLMRIGFVDILLIGAAFLLGWHILEPTAADDSAPWWVRTSLCFVIIGGSALLVLHLLQAIKSFCDDKDE